MNTLTPEQIDRTKKAISETAAIMRLEGFEKNARSYAIDEAVLAGRITYDAAIKEMCAWVAEHKSLEGFDESREWLKPLEFNTEDAFDMSRYPQTSPQAEEVPNFGTPKYREWKTEQLRRMATDPVYLETQMEFIRGARGYRG